MDIKLVLSTMDPSDLYPMPARDFGTGKPPVWIPSRILPYEGEGVIEMTEFDSATQVVQLLVIELLTTRTLSSRAGSAICEVYKLPPGYGLRVSPAAAVEEMLGRTRRYIPVEYRYCHALV